MPAADAGQAFALVVVDELVRHGVTDAVLAPGSRSTPVALALATDDRIRLHVRIDERSASFFALGLARASGRVVPVLCTSGTAAAEFHPAVLEADQSHVPLLVLTADRPPELRDVGANQTVDQVKLYGDAVRWFCDVGVPEARADAVTYWRSTVSRAIAAAMGASASAGPVHLNLPLREPLVPAAEANGFPFPLDGRADGGPWTPAKRAPQALPDDVRSLLESTRSAVVIAGDGLSRADADAVVSLAQRRAWPLLAEPHSNARRGNAAVVGADALLRDPTFCERHRPDLVVAVGRVGLSRATLGFLAASPAPTIVIDRAGRWLDPVRSATRVVAADPVSLNEVDGGGDDGTLLAVWRNAGAAVREAIDEVLDESEDLSEPRLARDLTEALPDGAVLTVASSMPIRDVDLVLRPRDGLTVVANRGVSGIDGFVSTAMATATVHAGAAWALAGDLSLLHDVNGLLAEPRPDITFVVVNNDGGGIFSLLPQRGLADATFERVWGTPHGLDICAVASAYGARAARLQSAADLASAVATQPSGVTVLEVRTDRGANAELHRRLADVSGDAVRRWLAAS